MKAKMIQSLLWKKVFPKFEVLTGHHLVVVDATSMHSFSNSPLCSMFTQEIFQWINKISHHKIPINWMDCQEEEVPTKPENKSLTRFCFITMEVNKDNVEALCAVGRAQ